MFRHCNRFATNSCAIIDRQHHGFVIPFPYHINTKGCSTMSMQRHYPINTATATILTILLAAAFIFFLILVVRALLKYLRSGDVRREKRASTITLGNAIKAHRMRCQMTQEFVAESLSVSRQAVSKWENGSSDPSTSNLIALAKLFKISPEELLRDVEK